VCEHGHPIWTGSVPDEIGTRDNRLTGEWNEYLRLGNGQGGNGRPADEPQGSAKTEREESAGLRGMDQGGQVNHRFTVRPSMTGRGMSLRKERPLGSHQTRTVRIGELNLWA
jgi:hypothetical protein